MAQISRPFQIALVGLVALGAVWLFAIRGHSSSNEPATASTATPAVQPVTLHPSQPPKSSAGSPTSVYHGSAPGVEGLTKAIASAHGAVATSEANAKQLEAKSAQASGESATHTSAAPATHASAPATSAAAAPSTTPAKPVQIQPVNGAPVGQSGVEQALAAGDVAAVLFWSPKGIDDRAVLAALHAAHVAKLKVFLAEAKQVAQFGSVTRGVQVYATPTLLIIGASRQAHVLTGLTDPFSIRQTVEEARAA